MSPGTLDGGEPRAEAIETRMASHVAELMSAARQSAETLQADVERAANARAAEIETAAARRAHEVRMAAEADAERLQVHNRAATQQYVAASRRLVDEFARERMRRIAEIGDRLGEQAAALVARLQRADDLARQVEELRAELGAACGRIAAESRVAMPELPQLDPPPSIAGEGPPPEAASAGSGTGAGGAGLATPGERLARATGRLQAAEEAARTSEQERRDDA